MLVGFIFREEMGFCGINNNHNSLSLSTAGQNAITKHPRRILGWLEIEEQAVLVISKYENNNTEKSNNMNIRLKKYLLIGVSVLFFGAANPAAAVTETQIALTTEATNDAIVNLEAALKAVTENKLNEAQSYVDATRSSASDILGRCSVEAKKERAANALKIARSQIKNGDSVAAEASLKEAIKLFKSLLVSVNNNQQPSLFK